MGTVGTASSTGDTASNKPRPRGGFRYTSSGGICIVQSSASSALLLWCCEDGGFDVNGSSKEFEALVGGGEGVGAIGEVSYAPHQCLARVMLLMKLWRVLNCVKSSVVITYLEWK